MSKIRQWLERSGAERIRETGENNLVSTCPFHKDRKPSFSMRTDNGLFVCYSEKCGAQGNLVNFLISALGWNSKKAIETASDMGALVSFPLEDFKGLPDYLRRKEQKPVPTIREGQLGLYDFCPSYLLNRGFTKRTLRSWEIGYDYGSNRVTIPVRDKEGGLIGISKRSVETWQEPKYLHLYFKRAHHVYGLFRAVSRTAVLVEGQLDALAWYQMDKTHKMFPLSTMGSFITNTQMKYVSQRYKRVVLAFDNDEAGRVAMRKAGDFLLPKIPRGNLFVLRQWPDGVKDVADFLTRERKDFHAFRKELELYNTVCLEN